MPTLARWYVKSALLYLLLAWLVDGLALAGWPTGAPWRVLRPTYWHLFLVGWVTQMIFGAAYWMFPIVGHGPTKRGDERPAWLAWGLLNAGLVLRTVAEPWRVLAPNPWAAGLLVAAAWLQWLAGVAFVVHIWPRIRGWYRRGRAEG